MGEGKGEQVLAGGQKAEQLTVTGAAFEPTAYSSRMRMQLELPERECLREFAEPGRAPSRLEREWPPGSEGSTRHRGRSSA